ncbi:hypothetical protein Scep_029458 [Stephania cephalantha]|uniref:Uncharacterized protein n=1 Tax=Stephania cephalantha TaxID=152367 RepID=A0AAP0E1A0_9MAGN
MAYAVDILGERSTLEDSSSMMAYVAEVSTPKMAALGRFSSKIARSEARFVGSTSPSAGSTLHIQLLTTFGPLEFLDSSSAPNLAYGDWYSKDQFCLG